MAIEVSKFIPQSKLILISTAKTKYELPWIYRLIGFLKLNKIIPAKLLKSNKWFLIKAFGVKNEESKNLLKSIINDTDVYFLKWAIDKILNWDNVKLPQPLIHIHGSKDRVIPHSNISNSYVVKNGGHFMVFDNSDEISLLINESVK